MNFKFIALIFMISFSANATNCFNNNTVNSIDSDLEVSMGLLIKDHLKSFKIPAASILIGSSSKVLYKKAFGKIDGTILNTENTIFDLASITKVFTAASILKVLEEQNLQVNDLIANVFPLNFNTIKKSTLTFEDLLRHKSGFKAGTGNNVFTGNALTTWKNILNIEPNYKYGDFKYSDVNYLVLGKSVEELSKSSLNKYVQKNIFNTIGMNKTSFNMYKKQECEDFCAPTNLKIKKGLVHDPTSRKLGGVAGHAGVFSTINDMSKFASVFLNKGMFCDKEILSEDIVKSMTTVDYKTGRGLGFDMLSPYSRRPRGDYFNEGESFGHTGFTGTSLWLDPTKDLFVILLTNTVFAKDEKKSKKGFLKLNLELSNLIGKYFSYR